MKVAPARAYRATARLREEASRPGPPRPADVDIARQQGACIDDRPRTESHARSAGRGGAEARERDVAKHRHGAGRAASPAADLCSARAPFTHAPAAMSAMKHIALRDGAPEPLRVTSRLPVLLRASLTAPTDSCSIPSRCPRGHQAAETPEPPHRVAKRMLAASVASHRGAERWRIAGTQRADALRTSRVTRGIQAAP